MDLEKTFFVHLHSPQNNAISGSSAVAFVKDTNVQLQNIMSAVRIDPLHSKDFQILIQDQKKECIFYHLFRKISNFSPIDVPFESLNFSDLEDKSHIRIEIPEFDFFVEKFKEIHKHQMEGEKQKLKQKMEEENKQTFKQQMEEEKEKIKQENIKLKKSLEQKIFFESKKRPDLVIPCMRFEKLIEIYQFLQTNCALLIKGPPGSGKTTMADLFEFYLTIKEPMAICYRINLNKNIKSDEDLLELFNKTADIFLKNFYLKNRDEYKRKIYIIIDECHEIFGDNEKQPFENFWKVIVEGPYQVCLKFLFCTVYSDPRIKGECFRRTPFVLQDRLRCLDFLKFTRNEFDEIVNYYSNSALSQTFPIADDQIKELIWQESNGFPQLTNKTIIFMMDNLNNSDKSYKTVHETIFSKKFQDEVINSLMPFSEIIQSLNYDERLFLRDLHIHHQVYGSPFTEKYDLPKYLERCGIIFENQEHYFSFPTRSLSSAYFNLICNDLSQEKIAKAELLKMDKATLALTALQRMKFGKVSKTKAEKTDYYGIPSKNECILEFYCALRSMIPAENEIHSQCNKIDYQCIGELDLYIDDEIKQPFEVTFEENTVKYHILRKYMDIYSDYLEKYKNEASGRYLFPNQEKYLVIEFRKNDDFERIKQFIVDDGKGNKLDLGPLMKKDIMRVCYGDFSKINIYYEEELVAKIIPSI